MKQKLKIYDSLTRKLKEFKPVKEDEVSMYVCGITPYNNPHIGHSRSLIVYDMINRYLKHIGYNVNFVRNVTDIDDKIINKSILENKSLEELSNYYYQIFKDCENKLDCLLPIVEPKVSEYKDQIIWFIEQLLKKEYAYKTNDGSIYFDLEKYKKEHKYPKLISKIEKRECDNIPFYDKKHIDDFALWKTVHDKYEGIFTKFGYGKLGWHIECSAIVYFTLNGNYTIDIHCGGLDLKFPHHENEIAQSEALIDCKYVNYWLHNGLVVLNDNLKISKSDGKTELYLDEILKKYHKDVIRYWMLNSHYRNELIFSFEILEEFKRVVKNIYTQLMLNSYDNSVVYGDINSIKVQEFYDFMNNDFNTHNTLILLYQLLDKKDFATFKFISKVLNLFQEIPENILHSDNKTFNSDIDNIIYLRDISRKGKDFVQADKYKSMLINTGIEILDTKDKTYWILVSNKFVNSFYAGFTT